ncbi:response regulator transcription factor [Crocinitomix catalasitica]|uniref:response regulator transcription factor n=1 Tax=Crocinitomix catalasitica TaxID=184607 RepID=UPI00048412E4|nr:response regulator transcription factor [Crocinitomix catalasitica]
MKILLVEDNHKLSEGIVQALMNEDFVCEAVYDFQSAEEKIALYQYDVMIIDINLPDGSGLNLIKKAKEFQSEAGIIVISARNSLDNKIEGLDLGADDYLTKPFDLAELIARVKSIMRRRKFEGSNLVEFESISIDLRQHTVSINNNAVNLTKSEFDILLFFISNTNRVLTKESIAEHIYGDNMDMADSFDFIYSHIKNLRKKMINAGGANYIKAVYGIGYKMSAAE